MRATVAQGRVGYNLLPLLLYPPIIDQGAEGLAVASGLELQPLFGGQAALEPVQPSRQGGEHVFIPIACPHQLEQALEGNAPVAEDGGSDFRSSITPTQSTITKWVLVVTPGSACEVLDRWRES